MWLVLMKDLPDLLCQCQTASFTVTTESCFKLLVPRAADRQVPDCPEHVEEHSPMSPDSPYTNWIRGSKCGEDVENTVVIAALIEQHRLVETV